MLAFLGVGWSTHVKIHFLSKQASDAFGQHKLRCILSYSWHDAGMVNTYLDIFCLFAVMGGVFSTHVEMYYLRAFLGVVWSTHVKIHFLSKLPSGAFGHTI